MIHLTFSNRIDILADLMSEYLGISKGIHTSIALEMPRLIIAQPPTAQYLKLQLAKNNHVCANFRFESSLRGYLEKLIENALDKPNSNRVLLTAKRAFSVLFPYAVNEAKTSSSLDETDIDLAISRSRMIAERIVKMACCVHVNHDLYERDGYYLSLIVDKYREQGVEIVLPKNWLNDDLVNALELPEYIFVFDPLPISDFEVQFLKLISKRTNIFICAYNPSAGYWNNLSPEKVLYADLPYENMFLTTRCREIASRIDASWREAIGENAEPLPVYPRNNELFSEACDLPNTVKIKPEDFDAKSLLSRVQQCTVRLDSAALNTNCADDANRTDDSIDIRIFNHIRHEVRNIANDIVAQIEHSGHNLLFDDICVLVPSSAVSDYAALIQCEFEKRNIPHNIRNLLQHPLSECYSAFEALICFLDSDCSRADTLRFAFHPGVLEREFMAQKDAFSDAVDKLGIFCGFEQHHGSHGDYYLGPDNQTYTWQGGIQRIVMMMYGNNHEHSLEPAVVDDSTSRLVLGHYHRIHAMLCDHQTLHQACLGLDEWRSLIICLFDAWLRPTASWREQGMRNLSSLMHQWWPEDLDDKRWTLDEAFPLLRAIARRLNRPDSNQLFGGVQIRQITPNVMTSKILYILGQSADNYPSSQIRTEDFEQYSRAAIDSYAWMKWFQNVEDRIVISASAAGMNDTNIIDKVSIFMQDLSKALNIDLRQCDNQAESVQELKAFDAIRQLYGAGKPENNRYPTSVQSFDSHMGKIHQLLNEEFINEGFDYCQDDGRPSDYAHQSGELAAETLDWNALYRILKNPYKTWRKYHFHINDYIANDSPDTRAQMEHEPVEQDFTRYEVKNAADDLLIKCLCHGCLDEFEKYYDMMSEMFKKSGTWPDGVYNDCLKQKLMMKCEKYKNGMESLKKIELPLTCIQVVLGDIAHVMTPYQRWMNVHFSPERVNRKLILKYHDKPIEIYGELLPIVRDRNDKCYFVVNEKMDNDLRIKIKIAICILSCLKREDPNVIVPVGLLNVNGFKEEEKVIDHLEPLSCLQKCLEIYQAGLHEIRKVNYNYKDDKFEYTQAPMQVYTGNDEICESASYEFWRALQDDWLFRAIFK